MPTQKICKAPQLVLSSWRPPFSHVWIPFLLKRCAWCMWVWVQIEVKRSKIYSANWGYCERLKIEGNNDVNDIASHVCCHWRAPWLPRQNPQILGVKKRIPKKMGQLFTLHNPRDEFLKIIQLERSYLSFFFFIEKFESGFLVSVKNKGQNEGYFESSRIPLFHFVFLSIQGLGQGIKKLSMELNLSSSWGISIRCGLVASFCRRLDGTLMRPYLGQNKHRIWVWTSF